MSSSCRLKEVAEVIEPVSFDMLLSEFYAAAALGAEDQDADSAATCARERRGGSAHGPVFPVAKHRHEIAYSVTY